jgi:hypothetical protein
MVAQKSAFNAENMKACTLVQAFLKEQYFTAIPGMAIIFAD